MNNEPAFPIESDNAVLKYSHGLTKLEYACIHLKIPKSGNEELDKLITESQLHEKAGLAMQGTMANSFTMEEINDWDEYQEQTIREFVAIGAVLVAKELIKKLEAEK